MSPFPLSPRYTRIVPRVRTASLLVTTLFTLVLLGLNSPVSAHNREKTSNPAQGDVLSVSPKTISFFFKSPVGSDSVTAFLIEPSGSRKPLNILSAGDLEVIVGLPPLADGVYSVRWKLISTDGHPVSNKVTFTVATGLPAPSTVDSASPSPVEAATALTTTRALAANVGPLTTVPPLSPTIPSLVGPPSTAVVLDAPIAPAEDAVLLPRDSDATDVGGAPNWLRWLLRFGSYGAIFALVGVLATGLFIWPTAFRQTSLRRTIVFSSLAVAVLALLQILILAIDIESGSFAGSLAKVRSFDVGKSLIGRTLLAAAAFAVSRHFYARMQQAKIVLVTLAIALLATWSYGGHAKSQRWAWIGFPIDIAHQAAAATWVVGLPIVAAIALNPLVVKRIGAAEGVLTMKRLSNTAFASVLIVVVTGGVQSIRLAGVSFSSLSQAHTRLITAKIFLVAVMLLLGNSNRKATVRLVARSDSLSQSTIDSFRQKIGIEVALGLFAMAVTASLVVRVPAASESAHEPVRQTTTQLALSPSHHST